MFAQLRRMLNIYRVRLKKAKLLDKIPIYHEYYYNPQGAHESGFAYLMSCCTEQPSKANRYNASLSYNVHIVKAGNVGDELSIHDQNPSGRIDTHDLAKVSPPKPGMLLRADSYMMLYARDYSDNNDKNSDCNSHRSQISHFSQQLANNFSHLIHHTIPSSFSAAPASSTVPPVHHPIEPHQESHFQHHSPTKSYPSHQASGPDHQVSSETGHDNHRAHLSVQNRQSSNRDCSKIHQTNTTTNHLTIVTTSIDIPSTNTSLLSATSPAIDPQMYSKMKSMVKDEIISKSKSNLLHSSTEGSKANLLK